MLLTYQCLLSLRSTNPHTKTALTKHWRRTILFKVINNSHLGIQTVHLDYFFASFICVRLLITDISSLCLGHLEKSFLYLWFKWIMLAMECCGCGRKSTASKVGIFLIDVGNDNWFSISYVKLLCYTQVQVWLSDQPAQIPF